jgi:amino acid transporter
MTTVSSGDVPTPTVGLRRTLRFFGTVHPKNQIPRNNVLLIGAICLIVALVLSYQLGTELLNYGALLAFMGVNAAAALRTWRTGRLTHDPHSPVRRRVLRLPIYMAPPWLGCPRCRRSLGSRRHLVVVYICE